MHIELLVLLLFLFVSSRLGDFREPLGCCIGESNGKRRRGREERKKREGGGGREGGGRKRKRGRGKRGRRGREEGEG